MSLAFEHGNRKYEIRETGENNTSRDNGRRIKAGTKEIIAKYEQITWGNLFQVRNPWMN